MTDPTDATDPTSGDAAAADRARVAERRARELREHVERIDQQVTDLAGQIATARSNHADLAATVSEELAPNLAAFMELATPELAKLRSEVDSLLTAAEKAKNPPVKWISMDAKQAQQQWGRLARWIAEEFVPWYEITREELPDCWALHQPVVLELSWLFIAHRQAYLTHSHPHITGEWHARWRPFVLDRIKDETKQCRPGKHQNQDGTPLALEASIAGTAGSPSAARTLLADVEYWWPFYAIAYHRDINQRLARVDYDGNSWTPAPPD